MKLYVRDDDCDLVGENKDDFAALDVLYGRQATLEYYHSSFSPDHFQITFKCEDSTKEPPPPARYAVVTLCDGQLEVELDQTEDDILKQFNDCEDAVGNYLTPANLLRDLIARQGKITEVTMGNDLVCVSLIKMGG